MRSTGRTCELQSGGRRTPVRMLALLAVAIFLAPGVGPVSASATSQHEAARKTQACLFVGGVDVVWTFHQLVGRAGETRTGTGSTLPERPSAAANFQTAAGGGETAVRAQVPNAAPPFYTEWWFLVLCVGVGVGGAALLHWARVRDLRQQVEALTEEARGERQRAETAIEQADSIKEISELKSRVLAELSHSFRTPLTLTLGPIENLLEGKHGALGDEARTQLRLAQRYGSRIRWLVDQLLDLAGLETGRMSLDPTEGNFVRVVARGLRSFEGLAERCNVRLSLEGSLDTPVFQFDELKVEKILANLLSGAFRSADEGETIRVEVHPVSEDQEGDVVELIVENVGVDPTAEREEGILNLVRQDGDLWETEGASTGIGLYLAEKLVDLHGGHIKMSGQVGEGVRFAVRLPRQSDGSKFSDGSVPAKDSEAEVPGNDGPDVLALSRKALSLELETDEPAPSEAPQEKNTSPGEQDRTTVLVIDDNEVVRTLVRSHLEPDYRVAEAEEGVAGYNLATTLLPDLVITDVMMPEMDGFELCRTIKQDPDIDHIPVLFLTARADLEDKVEGLDVGADAYMTKPFEPEELVAHVENLIATRRSLRESFREDRANWDVVGSGDGADRSLENMETAEEALPPTAERKPLKERIEEAISENLTDPEFEVSDLATETALSASQLRRRMKEIYDYTPVQLIRRRRLEAGARLLRERSEATIGEVAYAVGFNSQSYFSRSFRDEFGTSPSQHRARHEGTEA